MLAVTGAQIEADLAHPVAGAGDVALAGLLSIVEGFSDVDGRTGLGAFLAHLESAELLGSAEEVALPVLPGSVQLMTIHKAKGLEFPVVVLPHLSLGEFPGVKGMDRWTTQAHVVPFELRDDRHVLPRLDELTNRGLDAFIERCKAHDRSGDDRLAYVAVTRAKDLLIASGHWWGPTQAAPRGPFALPRDAAGAVDGDPRRDRLRRPVGRRTSAGCLAVTCRPTPCLTMVPELPWPAEDADPDDPTVTSARAGGGAAGGRRSRTSSCRPPPRCRHPSRGGCVRRWQPGTRRSEW